MTIKHTSSKYTFFILTSENKKSEAATTLFFRLIGSFKLEIISRVIEMFSNATIK